MATYEAIRDSFSSKGVYYKKGALVECDEAPSKHFKLIEGEAPEKESVEDLVLPLSLIDKSLADLKEIATLKEIKFPHNIGKEKLINLIVSAE